MTLQKDGRTASFPYGTNTSDQPPGPHDWSQKPMPFQLEPGLASWAYNLSKDVWLSDTPELSRYRASYVCHLEPVPLSIIAVASVVRSVTRIPATAEGLMPNYPIRLIHCEWRSVVVGTN